MDARSRAQPARPRAEFRARRHRGPGRQARTQLSHAAEGVARSRRAARGARQAGAEERGERHRHEPLRSRHRGVPDGAASDLLRRPPGEDSALQQDERGGGPAQRGRGLSDRARRGSVRRRQDDLVPAAPAAGQAEGPGRDLRPGHGPDQGSVPEGRAQHRQDARLPRPGHGRAGPGQFQHPEDPRGRRQLRARRRGGDLLAVEAAPTSMHRASASTASAWGATGRCGSQATTGASPRW